MQMQKWKKIAFIQTNNMSALKRHPTHVRADSDRWLVQHHKNPSKAANVVMNS